MATKIVDSKSLTIKDESEQYIIHKESSGSIYTYFKGELHNSQKCEKTGLTFPAQVYRDGFGIENKKWMQSGERHRDDVDPITNMICPAVIEQNYRRLWMHDGRLHRPLTEGPAHMFYYNTHISFYYHIYDTRNGNLSIYLGDQFILNILNLI